MTDGCNERLVRDQDLEVLQTQMNDKRFGVWYCSLSPWCDLGLYCITCIINAKDEQNGNSETSWKREF